MVVPRASYIPTGDKGLTVGTDELQGTTFDKFIRWYSLACTRMLMHSWFPVANNLHKDYRERLDSVTWSHTEVELDRVTVPRLSFCSEQALMLAPLTFSSATASSSPHRPKSPKQEVEKALELGASVIMVNNWDRITGRLHPKQAMAVRSLIPDQASSESPWVAAMYGASPTSACIDHIQYHNASAHPVF